MLNSLFKQKFPHAHLLIMGTLVLSSWAHANETLTLEGTPEEKGLAIVQASKAEGEGWKDSTANMKMTLVNAQGQESTRELRLKTLELQNAGDKSLSIFDTPADIRDTKMLTYSHIEKSDEQWLYLPALKRVKRIASKNKSGPFMGSEFSFEDLSSFEVAKYDFKYLGEETLKGVDCYKVESYPNYKHTGYSKLITWYDKEELRPQQTDYYDLKGELLKTQVLSDYTLYLDKFWRSHTSSMTNHKNHKKTKLEWTNYKFSQGLRESDFHQNVLTRKQ